LEGIVVKSTGSWYELKTSQGRRVQARLKGKFRIKGIKSTNPVAVGDKVLYEQDGEEVVIYEIKERKNYIIRKSINLSKQVQIIAANVDQLFLIVTIENPVTTLGFIDRFLVGAEAYRIPAVLVFNKVDILETELQKEKLKKWVKKYESIGYECIQISAEQSIGLEPLKDKMMKQVSILSGNSGVGKSTLINKLDDNLDLRVNVISDYHKSGQHTTTFSELFELEFGGDIIDTPGIKGFGNVEIEKEELAHFFPEMRAMMNECKFNNCVHIKEPHCSIKKAVENGEIEESRYNNYISIYYEDDEETYRAKGY
jgi:ribosome biogenesis GTPase